MTRIGTAALAAALALSPGAALAAATLAAMHDIEHLDTGGNWQRSALSLERRGDKYRTLVLEYRSIDRFHARDDEFSLAGHALVTDGIGMGLEFTTAVEPDIVPEFGMKLDLDYQLPEGFVAHLIGRRANFPEDTATGLGAGVEWYYAKWRLAYETVSTSLETGGSGTAHIARGDWYYTDESRVGISGAIGDEATRLSPDEVIITEVSAAAIAGRHWLNPRWGAIWALTWTEQGDFHTRTGGSLGLLYRF